MIEKLRDIQAKFSRISEEMADPDVASDPERYTKLAREYSELEAIVLKTREYEKVLAGIEESKSIIEDESDDELIEMAREELGELEGRSESLQKEIQQLLIPEDPNDSKNTIVEIRAGTGGDEAALFAGDLYRMYMKYCENNRWKTETISANHTERNGYKEIVFSITGKGAFGRLKFESGVHRVQRVPETESQGRVHTSAASVAILPEAEDIEVEFKEGDLRIDTFRASGKGGQHVNTTDSAIRIVHVPTGIIVSCQDEKSQHKNKAKALKVMKARIYDLEMRKQQESVSSQRRNMIRSGDRSEKIRTYNFPQGRVTDHRINLTLYRLEEVLHGSLDLLIDEIRIADQAERLRESIPASEE